jgi:hypothetical protein
VPSPEEPACFENMREVGRTVRHGCMLVCCRFTRRHFERGQRWPCNMSLGKLKHSIRDKTRRTHGQSSQAIIVDLNRTLRGSPLQSFGFITARQRNEPTPTRRVARQIDFYILEAVTLSEVIPIFRCGVLPPGPGYSSLITAHFRRHSVLLMLDWFYGFDLLTALITHMFE